MHVKEKGGDLVGSSSSSSSSPCKRQRFYIELKQGETAFISWKKLLKDAITIDQCPPLALQCQDDKSNVGQQENSFQSDGRFGHRSKSALSDNKQVMIPKIELTTMEGKTKDDSTLKLKDSARAHRIAHPTLQKCLGRSDTSSVVRDHQLEGLHDVPVMYSKKSSPCCGKLNRLSPVNVSEGNSIFSSKKKQDTVGKCQKRSFEENRINMKAVNDSSDVEENRINMKAVNDSSDVMGRSSATKFAPLKTYQRSGTLMCIKKSKVKKVEGDNLVGPTMATNVTRDPETFPPLKRKITNSGSRHILNPSPCWEGAHQKVAVERQSLLSKSADYAEHAKSKLKLSRAGNLGNLRLKPHLKESQMEVPGKTNLKIRFHLKPENGTLKYEEQSLCSLNYSRPRTPKTCRQAG